MKREWSCTAMELRRRGDYETKVVLSKRLRVWIPRLASIPPSFTPPVLCLLSLFKLITLLALISINPSVSREKKMSWFIAFYNAPTIYASFCGITVPSMMSSNYQLDLMARSRTPTKFNTWLSWLACHYQSPSLLSWSSTDHLTECWVQILLAEWWRP